MGTTYQAESGFDMTTQSLEHDQGALVKSQAVSRVLWQVLVLNVLVALCKIVVGVFTGTVAIVADGLHSTIDGTSNIIGLIGQRLAAQPPDKEHPYGHEKFETLATLAIGGMLMVTAWEVLKVAINRLTSDARPSVGFIQFGVLVATLVVNFGVTTYERRQSVKLQSDLLAADASHTLSDVWVTLSVIASLIAVRLGLAWMDAVAALAIVGFIAYTGGQILLRTSKVLVDAAPIASEEITQAITGTPGVQKVIRARSRGARDAVHVDLDVQVAPVVSTELAYNITDAIRERVLKAFPNASEVQIQVTPDTDGQPSYITAARAAADALGLGIHEILGVSTSKGKILEMHVEVPGGITLREAHSQIDSLEARLLEQPDIIEIVTHIEPAAAGNALPARSPEALQLQEQALAELAENFPQGHWHHPSIYRNGYGYVFATHYQLPGDISVEIAHQIAEEAELYLRSHFPQLQRVTIHTEPEEDE